MSERKKIAVAVMLTALLSSGATILVDQGRWQVREHQRQVEAQRDMVRIENEVRAMNIHRPPDDHSTAEDE